MPIPSMGKLALGLNHAAAEQITNGAGRLFQAGRAAMFGKAGSQSRLFGSAVLRQAGRAGMGYAARGAMYGAGASMAMQAFNNMNSGDGLLTGMPGAAIRGAAFGAGMGVMGGASHFLGSRRLAGPTMPGRGPLMSRGPAVWNSFMRRNGR